MLVLKPSGIQINWGENEFEKKNIIWMLIKPYILNIEQRRKTNIF